MEALKKTTKNIKTKQSEADHLIKHSTQDPYDSATGQDLGAASHKDTKISSGLPEGEEHHRTSVSIEDFNR